jgi:hypothetical protein
MTKRFETFVFPALGSRPIRRITAPELLIVLRRIEARGTNETAHRVRAACSRVFRYAVATGRAERDVAVRLVGTAGGDPVGQPRAYLILEPANSSSANLDAVRKPVFRLKLVYERAPEPRDFAHLLQSENARQALLRRSSVLIHFVAHIVHILARGLRQNGERLSYLAALRRIYAPLYARAVVLTEAYARLQAWSSSKSAISPCATGWLRSPGSRLLDRGGRRQPPA